MKKINSNSYGGKILSIAGVFLLVIPGIIKATMLVYKNELLMSCSKISFGIGVIIFAFFAGLLAIEFHQDKKLNSYYDARRNQPIPLQNGFYECASCGYRKIRKNDSCCEICGIRFDAAKKEISKN